MLHQIAPAPGSTHRRKRVARGNAGKGGTTAGRGTKGQQSRTGKHWSPGFEGGQTPLLRRQPKLGGFVRPRSFTCEVINLKTLEEKLEPGEYDVAALRSKHLLTTKNPVKILGDGAVTKKFSLSVHAASKSAKAALVKAGGSVTIIRS